MANCLFNNANTNCYIKKYYPEFNNCSKKASSILPLICSNHLAKIFNLREQFLQIPSGSAEYIAGDSQKPKSWYGPILFAHAPSFVDGKQITSYQKEGSTTCARGTCARNVGTACFVFEKGDTILPCSNYARNAFLAHAASSSDDEDKRLFRYNLWNYSKQQWDMRIERSFALQLAEVDKFSSVIFAQILHRLIGNLHGDDSCATIMRHKLSECIITVNKILEKEHTSLTNITFLDYEGYDIYNLNDVEQFRLSKPLLQYFEKLLDSDAGRYFRLMSANTVYSDIDDYLENNLQYSIDIIIFILYLSYYNNDKSVCRSFFEYSKITNPRRSTFNSITIHGIARRFEDASINSLAVDLDTYRRILRQPLLNQIVCSTFSQPSCNVYTLSDILSGQALRIVTATLIPVSFGKVKFTNNSHISNKHKRQKTESICHKEFISNFVIDDDSFFRSTVNFEGPVDMFSFYRCFAYAFSFLDIAEFRQVPCELEADRKAGNDPRTFFKLDIQQLQHDIDDVYNDEPYDAYDINGAECRAKDVIDKLLRKHIKDKFFYNEENNFNRGTHD